MKDLLGHYYEEEREERLDISSVKDLIKAIGHLEKGQQKVSDIYSGYLNGHVIIDNTLTMLLNDIKSRAMSIVGIVESIDTMAGQGDISEQEE